MKYKVVVTDLAEHDLRQAVDYISRVLFNRDSTLKLLEDLGQEVKALTDAPYRSALVNDERLAQAGIRFLLVHNYMVFYVVREQMHQVSVLRILYARRDWRHILNP